MHHCGVHADWCGGDVDLVVAEAHDAAVRWERVAAETAGVVIDEP
jgi:hypothetical protein